MKTSADVSWKHLKLSVTCTDHWLQVRIRRVPYMGELLPQVYELYLGTGCPVTRVLNDSFEFFYMLSSCGIRTYERSWGILIESSITYEPFFLNRRGIRPVFCLVKRNDSFTFVEKDLKDNSNISEKSFQEPVGKTNSTSSQGQFLETNPEASFGNSSSLAGLCTFF
ncbi:oocyte-secreted protein 1-like [Sus scrofa]|uniref:oocyte-secreted protein 1-like n=1 Tax=Sus scrofa TaxID=9823 RepID=UPI000A2B3477|nr:oocyte-secreted protein 1-like [Sus scrofa]